MVQLMKFPSKKGDLEVDPEESVLLDTHEYKELEAPKAVPSNICIETNRNQ